MDTSELVSGKSPLEDPTDISALDCPGSPSLNNSDSFSLLADDSQPDTSLFGSANLPPVLEESVLQGEQALSLSLSLCMYVYMNVCMYLRKHYGRSVREGR